MGQRFTSWGRPEKTGEGADSVLLRPGAGKAGTDSLYTQEEREKGVQ